MTTYSTPLFPEVQIADAINCEISAISAKFEDWFPVSNSCTVEVSGKPFDCYFNNSGKLELVLSAISGEMVWKN